MTLARRCRVVASGPDGLRLVAEPGECSGCVGCGGRCALLPAASNHLTLPAQCADGTFSPGQSVEVYLGERRLLSEAARGYGWPLLGLLAGAALGRAVAAFGAYAVDPLTFAGAAAGTLLGLSFSKRHSAPPCRVRPASDAG